jgi:hypothetical protein
VIAHIVLFRPKADLSDDELRLFAQLFKRVCVEVPGIERVRVGPVIGGGVFTGTEIGLSTYSVAAYLEFKDHQALEDYLQDPLHREFAGSFWSCSEETAIADAEMVDPKSDDLADLLVLRPKQ